MEFSKQCKEQSTLVKTKDSIFKGKFQSVGIGLAQLYDFRSCRVVILTCWQFSDAVNSPVRSALVPGGTYGQWKSYTALGFARLNCKQYQSIPLLKVTVPSCAKATVHVHV